MEVLRQLQHKTVPLRQRIAFIAPPTGEEAEAHVFMSAAVTQNIQKLPQDVLRLVMNIPAVYV